VCCSRPTSAAPCPPPGADANLDTRVSAADLVATLKIVAAAA